MTGIFLILALFVFSCSKNDSSSETDAALTEEDASDMVTMAVSDQTAGIETNLKDVGVVETKYKLADCGVAKDSSYSKSSADGAAITYAVGISLHSLMSCNGVVPSSFLFELTGTSKYDAPKVSSDDATSTTFNVDGLGYTDKLLQCTFSFERDGTQQFHVRNKGTYTSKLTLTNGQITFDKTTGMISGGTAEIQISGESSSKSAYSYSAELKFEGNQQATLTFANGNVYQLSW